MMFTFISIYKLMFVVYIIKALLVPNFLSYFSFSSHPHSLNCLCMDYGIFSVNKVAFMDHNFMPLSI